MTSALPGATFRDPAGSLSFEDDLVIRRMEASARVAVLDLLDSPFCHTLQERGDLIDAEVDDSGGVLCLRHPKIPIPTYPWEWTPSQWLAAAELTLESLRGSAGRRLDSQRRNPAQHPLHRHSSHLRRHPLFRAPRSAFLHLARVRAVCAHLPAAAADEPDAAVGRSRSASSSAMATSPPTAMPRSAGTAASRATPSGPSPCPTLLDRRKHCGRRPQRNARSASPTPRSRPTS